MDGADFCHLMLKNNLHGRFKTIINYPFFFNQDHYVNHLLKPLLFLMRLGDTKKTRMDQLMYCVNKTDDHIEECAPNLNNTDILPPEGHQVPELTKDDKVDQDTLALGAEDDYCGFIGSPVRTIVTQNQNLMMIMSSPRISTKSFTQ